MSLKSPEVFGGAPEHSERIKGKDVWNDDVIVLSDGTELYVSDMRMIGAEIISFTLEPVLGDGPENHLTNQEIDDMLASGEIIEIRKK